MSNMLESTLHDHSFFVFPGTANDTVDITVDDLGFKQRSNKPKKNKLPRGQTTRI